MLMTSKHLKDLSFPTSTIWLLEEIAESKGKQSLFTHQSPQRLKAIRDQALIQSVESSNRIEGVVADPHRLAPLVLGRAKPRDRSESEIQGYRNALNLIHGKWDKLEITPKLCLEFHAMIQAESGDAGQWKQSDNEIVELHEDHEPTIRFRPTSAKQTPNSVAKLCDAYQSMKPNSELPSLVLDAFFILDFLCIHPFRDGNGRVSRLLSLLTCYQNGYEVGRFISLERLVETAKEDYYDVLYQCSQGWHEDDNEWLPWTNFYLGIIRNAYSQLVERASREPSGSGIKRALIEEAVMSFADQFSLSELEQRCPGVSRDMVRRVLRELRDSNQVQCLGRGPGAKWQRTPR